MDGIVAQFAQLALHILALDGITETQIVVIAALGNQERVEALVGNGIAVVGIDVGHAVVRTVHAVDAVAEVYQIAHQLLFGEDGIVESFYVGHVDGVVNPLLNGSEQVVGAALLAFQHHVGGIFGRIDHDELIVAAEARARFAEVRVGEVVHVRVIAVKREHRAVVGNHLPERRRLAVFIGIVAYPFAAGIGIGTCRPLIPPYGPVVARHVDGEVLVEAGQEQVALTVGGLIVVGGIVLHGPSVGLGSEACRVELAGGIQSFGSRSLENVIFLARA